MTEAADSNAGQQPEATPAGAAPTGSRKLPKLKLPAVKLPAVKLPAVKLPAAKMPRLRRPRLPRPGRPALADLVFSIGAASLVTSLLFVITEPTRARLQARTDEATVVANAATLQLAAETFAAVHAGHYPRSVVELLPYLPQGTAPRNPYTGEPTLFRGIAGDLTYRPSAGGGYVIEAWGSGTGQPQRLTALRGGTPAAHH